MHFVNVLVWSSFFAAQGCNYLECGEIVTKCAEECLSGSEECIKCMGSLYEKCRKCLLVENTMTANKGEYI